MKRIFSGWLAPAIATLLLWGIWGFLPKIALKTLSPEETLFYEGVGGLFVTVPLFAALGFRIGFDRRGYAVSALQAAVSVASLAACYHALETGPVSVIVTMTALYPLVSILLAAVFLKEKVSRAQGVAVGMAVLSVWLLGG